MKPNPDSIGCRLFRASDHHRRIGAWVTMLAFSVGLGVQLDARVIDDFAGPAQIVWSGNDLHTTQTNGELVISGRYPLPPLPSDPWRTYETGYWPASLGLTLLDQQTLEVRMDLVRASADDVYFILGVQGPTAGYMLLADENEVALVKFGFTALPSFFWVNAPVTNRNVTLALAFTRMTNCVLITTKVMDKASQRVLFEQSVTDGPGSDCGLPMPPPHGLTVFTPDSDPPETTFSVAWTGVFQWTIATPPPPVEVIADNLEYDVYHPPHLEIARATNGVNLNWLLPLEEQIVVAADQLAGPWCPCPQPHTRNNETNCLTMPCQSPQKFFKLTAGRQVTDDFTMLNPGWVPWYQHLGEEWTVTNGFLRFDWNAPTNLPGIALCPLGATNSEAVLRNVYMSVDLLDCVTSTNNVAVLALAARATLYDVGGYSYFGAVSVNYGGVRGIIRPWIYGDYGVYTYGATMNVQDYPLPYRLQFSVVGNKLQLRVLHLATGHFIGGEVNVTGSAYPTGTAALWVNGRVNPGDSFTLTADNFFLSGTK